MKKMIPLLLVLCLLSGLCACGSEEEETVSEVTAPVAEVADEPVTETTPEPQAQEQAAVPAEQAVQTQAPADPEENDQLSRPESGSNANEDSNTNVAEGGENGENAEIDLYSLAQSYLGTDAGTFQSAVGAPSGSEYTISCMAEGAEDGVWYYDGFVVYTLRQADGTEVVVDCDAY